MKDKYLNDIKSLQEVNFSKICKDNNINYSNVYNGLASEKTIKLARDEYIKELKEKIKKIGR